MAPPGLIYLARLLLPQIVSVLAIYGALTILRVKGPQQYHLSTSSTWICLLFAFLARPSLYLFQRWYAGIRDARRAADKGAVLPPKVAGSNAELLTAFVKSRDDYTAQRFLEWSQQYGYTYRLNIFDQKRLMTTEPEIIKTILATRFEDFEKGPVIYQLFHSLLGSGVFNSDGEMWKFHRNMTRPYFTKNRISDFDNFERHSEQTISLIRTRLAQGYPVDFQDAVARFTLDSATEFLFDRSVESLGANLPYPEGSAPANDPAISEPFVNHPSNVFVRAFFAGQDLTAKRGSYGMNWPLKEFWKDAIKPHREKVDSFISPILEERTKKLRDMNALEKANGGEEETFLDNLIRSTKDKQVIKDELVNILVAGRDTTASLLTFAIYVLTERPDLTERLRGEVLEKIGPNARPTYKDISEMKYLRAFINETLRLYPAVPFDGRSCKVPVLLPAGKGRPPFYVPADTDCVYSVFLMHRREDLWGPDALEFDPDRFIDERLRKYLTPNPFIFLPFNAGPRICLGQQFAYNEASYFLIKFLQSFTDIQMAWDVQPESSKPPAEWRPAPGTTKGRDKVLFAHHLTMSVKDALWVRMKDENAVGGV